MIWIALTDIDMAIVDAAECIAIIVLFAALFFGAKKISEPARSFGMAAAEYERAKIKGKKDLLFPDQRSRNNIGQYRERCTRQEKPESIANALGISYCGLTDIELKSSIQAEIKKDKNTAQ